MKSVCCNAGYNYLGLNFVYLNQQEYLFKPDGHDQIRKLLKWILYIYILSFLKQKL